MFASDGQRAWRNAITLIAKREWLLSGDTLTVRRTEEDLTVEIIRRPQGESTASNLTTLNFQTLGVEADTSAARVTHYSIFDRTPADIDDPDLAGDLDHLAASLDYLDYLASQKTFKKTSKKKSFGYQCRSFTGSSPVREGGGLTRWETTIRLSREPLSKWGEGKMKFQVGKFTCEVLLGDDGKLVVRWFPEPPKYLNKAERDRICLGSPKWHTDGSIVSMDRRQRTTNKGSICILPRLVNVNITKVGNTFIHY